MDLAYQDTLLQTLYSSTVTRWTAAQEPQSGGYKRRKPDLDFIIPFPLFARFYTHYAHGFTPDQNHEI